MALFKGRGMFISLLEIWNKTHPWHINPHKLCNCTAHPLSLLCLLVLFCRHHQTWRGEAQHYPCLHRATVLFAHAADSGSLRPEGQGWGLLQGCCCCHGLPSELTLKKKTKNLVFHLFSPSGGTHIISLMLKLTPLLCNTALYNIFL